MHYGSVSQIVKHFGGQSKFARRLGIKQPNIWRWEDRNWFPANTYFAITDLLRADNCTAADTLWRMREPSND